MSLDALYSESPRLSSHEIVNSVGDDDLLVILRGVVPAKGVIILRPSTRGLPIPLKGDALRVIIIDESRLLTLSALPPPQWA